MKINLLYGCNMYGHVYRYSHVHVDIKYVLKTLYNNIQISFRVCSMRTTIF